MGKDSSQFLTSLYLGSLSILSLSSCNAESITVFGTPINSPIKYKGVLFDLDSCAIFMSKKKLCETNRPRVFYCPPTGITFFLFLFFQTGKTGMRESYFSLWLPHHRKGLDLRSDPPRGSASPDTDPAEEEDTWVRIRLLPFPIRI